MAAQHAYALTCTVHDDMLCSNSQNLVYVTEFIPKERRMWLEKVPKEVMISIKS